MFYVEYCRLGVSVSYESMCGRAFSVYAFETQMDRAEWLEDNAEDSSGKLVARKVTRKVALHSILHTNDIRLVELMGDDVADTHGIQWVIPANEGRYYHVKP